MAKLEKSQFTALIRSFPKNTVPNFLHYPSSDIWQGKLEQLRPGILQFTTLSVWIQWLQVVTFSLQKNLFKSNLKKNLFFLFSTPFFFQFSRVPQKIVLEIWTHIVWKSPTNVSVFKCLNFCAKIALVKSDFWRKIQIFLLSYFFQIIFRQCNLDQFFPVFISEKSLRCIYVYRPFYRQRTTLFDCKGSCSSLGSGGHGSRST